MQSLPSTAGFFFTQGNYNYTFVNISFRIQKFNPTKSLVGAGGEENTGPGVQFLKGRGGGGGGGGVVTGGTTTQENKT